MGIKEIHPDDQRNIELYQSLLAKHGETFRALDWGSRESQVRRFEVLAEVGIKDGDHILDVGCGLADFYAWLLEHKPGVKYSGIDITPAMVDHAQARFPDISVTNATLFDLSLPENSFDYLVASGIFFFRNERPEQYLHETIRKMFFVSKKGIAFNSLSSWARKVNVGEFYASPSQIIDFCRTLSPFVVLRHDYHVADFTVYVYHSVS
jgi:ubiquinone/menaquinone biosynthesis C-methylase UbiE